MTYTNEEGLLSDAVLSPIPTPTVIGTPCVGSPTRFRFTDGDKRYLLVTRPDGTHLVYVNVSRKGTRWSHGAVPSEDMDRLINLATEGTTR